MSETTDGAGAGSRHHFLTESPTCPKSLLTLAQQKGKARTVVIRADAPLPMLSCAAAVAAGICEPIFIGNYARILAEAAAIGWDISAYEIVETEGEQAAADAAMAIVRAGLADVVMKGQVHTDVMMKAVVNKVTGIRGPGRLLHVFHLTPPHSDRPIIISDCAVNVLPDLETRKASLRAVVDVAHAVGIARPKVALLSATEEPITSVPSAVEARQLSDWANANIADAVFSGPLALDLILSKTAAAAKNRQDDEVTGAADAIVVPDLVSGNVLFKALVYFRSACAAGVVLGGLVPIVLTSRADPPEARLASLALANILARPTSSS
ncbi:MAG: phosphate acetyltransferase [Hyphomicrobiaceae bacterium]|nr:phosphate acetyltransferase [Hyphomicrobiaceae bacterium]